MTPAELARKMAGAGASPELIVMALEAMQEQADAIEARRAGDRERKRRQRARDEGVTVTGQSRDMDVTVTDKPFPAPAPSFPPDPQTNPTPTHTRARSTRAREGWHRLAEDWQPSPLPAATQAKVDLWPPGEVEEELEALKNWARNAEDKNGKGRKLDWDAAWIQWLNRHHRERRPPPTRRVGPANDMDAAMRSLGFER